MKTKNNMQKRSVFLCFLLRHKPEAANLNMDTQGWVSVDELLTNLKTDKKNNLSFDELKELVADDKKGRYSFKKEDDAFFVRCNQGHSLNWVKIIFDEWIPVGDMYHGTSPKLEAVILKEGIKQQSRNFVHLSKDLETARVVGKRHSKEEKPLIFVISKDAPIKFWITDNGVLQAKHIPAKYLSVLG